MTDHPGVVRVTATAVLFDMDGVLLDSTAAVEALWVAFATEHDLDPAAVVTDLHGRRMVDVMRVHLPGASAAELTAAVHRFEDAEVAGADRVRVLPGAAALTATLAERPWGIVTSSNRVVALARLAHSALPTPPVLVTADDVRRGKPAPDPYLQAAAALGVAASTAVVFEDAPAGITAARAAGCHVVALSTSHGPGELTAAHLVIGDLAAVAAIPAADGGLELHLRV